MKNEYNKNWYQKYRVKQLEERADTARVLKGICRNCGGMKYIKRKKYLDEKKYSWYYVVCPYCNDEK